MEAADKYLTNKHVLLSSEGTKYNDLYYSKLNSSVSMVECTFMSGKYQQSLSSLSFNSTSSVVIPNSGYLGTTWLTASLPAIVANQSLCRGWLLACIQEISYTFGASNTSSISLSGEGLYLAIMGMCKSVEKRSEILRLAGEEWLAPYVSIPGRDDRRVTAAIPLVFPWSTVCDKLPYDTAMLNAPINIQIKFKAARSIFGGSAVPPTAFESLKLTFREGDLSNTNMSLKVPMQMDPSLIYSYPCNHLQAFPVTNIQGRRVSEGIRASQATLTGFINSDLTGIYLYLVRETDINPATNNSPSPLNCAPIYNPRLDFNGTPIYVSDEESWKLFNMHGEQDASFVQNSVIRAGTTSPFLSDPVDCYPLFIDFSRLRDICYQDHFNNTFRISNQVLNFTFNTEESVTYRLYALYVYNAIVETRAGASFVYFD